MLIWPGPRRTGLMHLVLHKVKEVELAAQRAAAASAGVIEEAMAAAEAARRHASQQSQEQVTMICRLSPSRDARSSTRFCIPCGIIASSTWLCMPPKEHMGLGVHLVLSGPSRRECYLAFNKCARKRAQATPYHSKHALEVLKLRRRVASAEEAAAGKRMRLAAAKATDPKAHLSCMQALEVLELRDRVACLEEAAAGARSRLAAASDDVHRLERATLALEERLAAAQRCCPVPCWAVLKDSIHMLSLLCSHVNWIGPADFLHPHDSYQLSMHDDEPRNGTAVCPWADSSCW